EKKEEPKKAPAKKTTTATKAAPKKEAEKKEEPKKAPAKKTTTATKAAPKKEAEKKEEPKKAPVKKTTTAVKTAPKKEAEKKTPAKKTAAAKPAEDKGRTYTGKYEVYPSADGYQYRLKASNGEVLVVSEVYTTKDSALKAIDAVKRNVEDGEIRIIKDKRGLYKFKLTSKNYRVLALGSSYSTEKSAVRSSESFKNFALKATTVEIDTPADQDNIVEPYLDITTADVKVGGKYVVEKYDGEFSWDLKASNGQILCQAEGYTSKSGALSSIESFKKNVETGTFKILKDKNGNFHYNLYTASG
ncbi:MAG: YegP family protein, partial [Anaeroplasmataceae bacterium]|nr:YegP family protein [Anaeroplasmataceae bacterium]